MVTLVVISTGLDKIFNFSRFKGIEMLQNVHTKFQQFRSTLLTISSSNVLMLAHDGYYHQHDGLAMGIPPAPPLANGLVKSVRSKD